MDADSIVIGNVWEHFRECWHERFIFIYCQSSAGTLTRNRIIGYLVISSSYIVRDVICMPPKSLRKTKVTWQFFSLVRTYRFCIHPKNG